MAHWQKIIAFVLVRIIVVSACGAVTFSRFPSSWGFPQTNISGIVQDRTGDIWIGSADGGVYRYDGSQIFKIDNIRASGLFADMSGRVFVCTHTKIYVNDGVDSLKLLFSKSGGRCVRETPDGDVFFLSSTHLAVLRSGRDTVEIVSHSEYGDYRSMEYLDGNIYVGCLSGLLFRMDIHSLEQNLVKRFSNEIQCIVKDSEGKLWISCYGCGVSCFNVARGEEERTLGKIDGLSSDNLQSICFENDSVLWLGSHEGLNIYNLRDSSVQVSRYHFFDDKTLSHDSVKALYKDKQGGMWVGTYFGGICYYHKSRNRFKVFSEGLGPDYLNDSVVSCITEGPDGTLWIGTNNGGINVYDPRTKTFGYYHFKNADGFSDRLSNDVKAFCFLPDGNHVLVGLFRGGLNLLDRGSGVIEHLKSPRDVVSISVVDEDHLLLSSYDEVFSYCISSGEYSKKDTKPVFARFKKSKFDQGLKIASELKDNEGNIWYATDNGLFRMSLSDSSFVHYSMADGLACDFYNPGAACMGSDGTMYFGGVGGVTYFNPSSFGEEEECPHPLIRSIKVNEDISLNPGDMIRLKHSQNRLNFEFSVPDFISVGSNEFEYRLDGLEKEWNKSGNRNSAYYPNLPAGVYQFRLRVSRGNSRWVESVDAPRIRIFRPWYSSVVGVIAEILVLVLSAFYVERSISRRKEMEHALALNRMEEKYQRDISKLKALRLVNTNLRIDEKTKPVIEDISRQNELFITKAMSIVEANLSNEEFTTEILAQKLSMSRASLHKRITEATGESALEFIQKIRFSEACRLLEKGELQISEIGYQIGIKRPSYFSSSFKKVVGCSPKEYIARQKRK